MKKKLSIILAITLVMSLLASTISVSAQTNQERLDSINAQISSAKAQLNASQKTANSLTSQISALDQQIYSTENAIEKLQKEIEQTLAQIEVKKKELDVKSKEISTQNDDMGSRLSAMYKTGEVGYIEIILGSESFGELLSNIDMITKLYQADEDFLAKLQTQYDTLADTKKELEELNIRLEAQREELKAKQAALQHDKESAEILRANAMADVAAQNELIDGLNADAQEISALIREEQRKAAEAAAKKAAAEKAAKEAAEKAAAEKAQKEAAAKKAAEEAANASAADAAAKKAAAEKAQKEAQQAAAKAEASAQKAASAQQAASSTAAASGAAKFSSGGTYILPAPSYTRISSPYGYRIHPISKTRKLHTGIDFGAPAGTRCVASRAGTVILSGWNGGYGYCVVIDHGGGIATLYGHNSKLLVTKGQKVAQGETIALIGSTGNSTGPHCHFEVRVNGAHTNPMPYLTGSK